MSASTDLSLAKKNLQENLGDNMQIYLQNLRSWFKQKITKEEFDAEARSIVSENYVHLHNEFLLAIISRCQTLSSTLIPKESSISSKLAEIKHRAKLNKFRRKSASRGVIQQKFVPAHPKLPQASYTKVDQHHSFASREHSLPDITMVHGQMLVCAWESGLDEVSDTTVKLVMQAVENQLKNIISLMLSRRSGYKLREKKMRLAMGSQVTNPYLRRTHHIEDDFTESEGTAVTDSGAHVPSMKLHTELAESQAIELLTVESQSSEKAPASLWDLLQTLQLYRSSIPSHTVYAPAVERVIHKLWHSSQEEIDQEIIHQQEIHYKQTLGVNSSTSIR